MAIFGIFDLLIGGGPIVGLAAVVVAWLRGTVGVSAVWALGGVLALLVVFNVAYFNGFGTDPVIGTPTRAQVTGTWVGDHDAMLVLRPDGTFTASGLPAYVGAVMAFPGQKSGLPQNPPSGHGTWTIGPGDFNGPPESVIFTFACAPGPGRCATFDLQAETSSPAAMAARPCSTTSATPMTGATSTPSSNAVGGQRAQPGAVTPAPSKPRHECGEVPHLSTLNL